MLNEERKKTEKEDAKRHAEEKDPEHVALQPWPPWMHIPHENLFFTDWPWQTLIIFWLQEMKSYAALQNLDKTTNVGESLKPFGLATLDTDSNMQVYQVRQTYYKIQTSTNVPVSSCILFCNLSMRCVKDRVYWGVPADWGWLHVAAKTLQMNLHSFDTGCLPLFAHLKDLRAWRLH